MPVINAMQYYSKLGTANKESISFLILSSVNKYVIIRAVLLLDIE